MSNRTLIYARVSTEDQVEKYGLPVQLRSCREYAKLQGYEVVAEICDEGISGATLDRPGLSRVREMARTRQVDVVLMLDVDRLSRQLLALLQVKQEIELCARLEFVVSTFENSPSGELFFGIRGVVGQYERALTRQRTMRGQRERVLAGLMVGGRVPYGYRYEPGEQRRYSGRLVIDDARAAVVREIFAWCLAGVSLRETAERLTQRAVPSSCGKPWGHTTVRWILGSPTYTGAFRWKAQSGAVAIPVPALIEQDVWDRVQIRLAENVTAFRGRPSRTFLLSGMVQCGCGKKMHAEAGRGRKYPVYRCTARTQQEHSTCRRSVNGAALELAVWKEIVRGFSDAELLCELLRRQEQELRQSPNAARLEELRSRVGVLRRREAAALDLLLDAELDGPELKARYRGLQLERTRAEQELRRIDSEQRALLGVAEWLDSTVDLLREDLQKLTDLAERREFMKSLQSRIEWDGEQATIRCFFVPEMFNTLQRSEHFRGLEVVLNTRLAA